VKQVCLAAVSWGRRAGTVGWVTSSRTPSVAEGETSARSPGQQALIRCLLYKKHGPAPEFRKVQPQGKDLIRLPDGAGILHAPN